MSVTHSARPTPRQYSFFPDRPRESAGDGPDPPPVLCLATAAGTILYGYGDQPSRPRCPARPRPRRCTALDAQRTSRRAAPFDRRRRRCLRPVMSSRTAGARRAHRPTKRPGTESRNSCRLNEFRRDPSAHAGAPRRPWPANPCAPVRRGRRTGPPGSVIAIGASGRRSEPDDDPESHDPATTCGDAARRTAGAPSRIPTDPRRRGQGPSTRLPGPIDPDRRSAALAGPGFDPDHGRLTLPTTGRPRDLHPRRRPVATAEALPVFAPRIAPPARPELLAPAGDRDCLVAAVENGADAVYFGLRGHNARARATNFDLDELPEVMGLLHRRGVRGYVTLNTLVFPGELEGLEAIVRRVAASGRRRGDRPGPRPGAADPGGHAGPGDPRLDPDVGHQQRRGPAGRGTRAARG